MSGAADRALHLARQVKHAGFVARKRLHRTARAAAVEATSAAWRHLDARDPYSYPAEGYRRTFLNWDAEPSTDSREIPRRIFCVWTGPNPLTPRRTHNLELLRAQQAPVPVELVTPATLDLWIVPEHPLHPAYEHLSLVHRSDYLRAYLLHHHGGGYADIKQARHGWRPQFERFEDTDLWLLRYPERSTGWVAQLPRELGRDLRRHYRIVPGGSGFLARPGSTLTTEWLAEIERRLDYASPLLMQHPGGRRDEVDAYPFGWNDLLAKILHPLALKHHHHIEVSERLALVHEDYQ